MNRLGRFPWQLLLGFLHGEGTHKIQYFYKLINFRGELSQEVALNEKEPGSCPLFGGADD